MDDAKQDMNAAIDQEYNSALMRTDILFVVVIIVSIITAYISGSKIVAPLKKIQSFAESLSKGNLTTDVDVNSRSEIGQMAASLRIAQDNMRGLLQGITEVSNRGRAVSAYSAGVGSFRGAGAGHVDRSGGYYDITSRARQAG